MPSSFRSLHNQELCFYFFVQRISSADDAGRTESSRQPHLPEWHGCCSDWRRVTRATGRSWGNQCESPIKKICPFFPPLAFWICLNCVVSWFCRSQNGCTRLCLCWRRSTSWVNCSSALARRWEAPDHTVFTINCN